MRSVTRTAPYADDASLFYAQESGIFRKHGLNVSFVAQATPVAIEASMQSGTEQAVKLKQPLPIYLVYFTAWEADGALKTVPDVYGLDKRHDAAKGQ